MPPPKVSVALPQTGSVQEWDEYPGHIEAVEMVEVKARVPGYLDSIHFQDGAEVKAGDLLFVIDPRPYQAELARAQAERLRAETRLELTKNEFQRATKLHASHAISDEEFDTRAKTVREAEAALAAARAAQDMAQLNLGYTRITAPINGRIGRRLATVGNLIQTGGVTTPALATLVSLDPIYCYFDADEPAYLRYRTNRLPALPCELALVDGTAFSHKGRVDFFDNQINSRSGTIRMRGVFANPDRALVPGMFARARVPAGPPAETLLVPAVAVSSDQGQKFVLVVNQQSMVEVRPIKAGRQHGAMVAVAEGLTPQDRVIVSGLLMARPGIQVEVVDAPATP
jgi:multidrug efflux system membrane fusion protein